MRVRSVLLIVVVVVVLMAACKKEEEAKGPVLSGEVPIGYICASPDQLEPTGTAIDLAIQDVNEYAKSLGRDITFKVYTESAEGSAEKALENAQTLYARGIRFVVGSNWSGQCKAILDYANQNHLLLVSDGSTAPELAIANDYLFRLPATDETQTLALSIGVLREIGIDGLVVLQRADSWGDGNAKFIDTNFTAQGGEIAGNIRYASDKTEFAAEVRELNEVVTAAIAKYGQDKVAIGVWSFEEITAILNEAANYETLMSVPWIGSNGITQSTRIIDETPDIAKQMKILSMMLGVTQSDKYQAFRDRYYAALNLEPGAYNTFAYDAVWLIAKSILEVGEYDPVKVQGVFLEVASDYFGAGGWYDLNEFGDRHGAAFEIWTIVEEAGAPVWKKAAMFDMASMKTSWILRPAWLAP
jgi:branched-chain amino acid transport system substrate-binding protein